MGGPLLEVPINVAIPLTNFDISPQRRTWCFLQNGKKLACWNKVMAPGLEVGICLVNCTEQAKMGMFEKLDADI